MSRLALFFVLFAAAIASTNYSAFALQPPTGDAPTGSPTTSDDSAASAAVTSPEATAPSAADQAAAATENDPTEAGQEATTSEATTTPVPRKPFIILAIGIATVLGLIIGFKVNAFLSLIIAATVVSLLCGGNPGDRMDAVVRAFGSSAGGVGITIAMAAIIGKCMLDSGAADRVVRTAVNITGERKASAGLMGSGFLLAVPVFFDTVFYLLVPLARSLHRRTGKNYLRYLMAIATGGAITHTLVPPTPGPLLVAATLGVDIGMMIFIGILVAVPAATVGLIFSIVVDRIMPVEMRPLGPGSEKHEPLPEDKLPSLGLSLLPVLLPLILIGLGTLATTLADREDRAKLSVDQVKDFPALRDQLRQAANASSASPAGRFVTHPAFGEEALAAVESTAPLSDTDRELIVDRLNRVMLSGDVYDEDAFRELVLSDQVEGMLAAHGVRTKPVDRRRMNRLLLEQTFPDAIEPHQWETSMRKFADATRLWSNANFALLLAALVAIATLKIIRGLSLRDTANEVEESLMSGGVIILITAAGGAFGAMLGDAEIGGSIKQLFSDAKAGGIELLLLAYVIAAVLKIAQGSSTVAMIVAAGMIGAVAAGVPTTFHPVYLATAIGSGSLFGSWMNDSGFWVFAKMGGLTEGEALRSWTLLLIVLSVSGIVTTIVLSQIMPMVG